MISDKITSHHITHSYTICTKSKVLSTGVKQNKQRKSQQLKSIKYTVLKGIFAIS